MEVKDVFELRKQGKIEEAYNAIRPMYASHKGHYTTIAMFWVGVDIMKLRYQQRRLEEAYKIFQSLMRLYPTMDDSSLRGKLLFCVPLCLFTTIIQPSLFLILYLIGVS